MLGSCARTITEPVLLDEMLAPKSLAEYPSVPYKACETTSHDRRSVEPGNAGWFANNDGFGFVRTDTIAGRVEKVLFEDDNPGVITRFWLTTQNPSGAVIRFYFDGSDVPGWVIPSFDLTEFGLRELGGLLQTHTSYEKGVKGGSTLYLPIPYARSCKVTLAQPSDREGVPRYYQINYRSYPKGTPVETFSVRTARKYRDAIRKAGERIRLHPEMEGTAERASGTVKGGDSLKLELPKGSKAVTELELKVASADAGSYEAAMRESIVSITFDGVETVNVPLSDFSGGGMGAPRAESRYMSADGKGKAVCRWVMPYAREAYVTVTNLSDKEEKVSVAARVADYRRGPNTLYFHSSWHSQPGIGVTNVADSCKDWNFASIKGGRGVYVGDVLSLFNYTKAWYGEGDEKIYVDGERFPSHFGTGTEDYYNSSWAPVVPFNTPYGGAPRADMASSSGYNTFFRTRALDVIPFSSGLRFDIEMMSWIPGKADYSATVFWYGDLKSSAVTQSDVAAACKPLPPAPADPSRFEVGGCIEFEDLEHSAKSGSLQTNRQDMAGFPDGKWSRSRQVTCYGGRVGDSITYEFGDLEPGTYSLSLYATKANDYGCMAVSVNGKRVKEVDCYATVVTDTGAIDLGTASAVDGRISLTVSVAGQNPASRSNMFGLDCVVLKKVE